MEKLDEALAKITNTMNELAQTHGADAVDLTLEVARMHAITGLTIDVVLAVVCAFMCKMFYSQIRYMDGESFYHELVAPTLAFVSGFVAVFSAASLFLVYRWYGIFEPKIYIAYKMFDKVL